MINNARNLNMNVSFITKRDIVNLVTCYPILTAGTIVFIADTDRNKTFCIVGDGETETRDLPILLYENNDIDYVSKNY